MVSVLGIFGSSIMVKYCSFSFALSFALMCTLMSMFTVSSSSLQRSFALFMSFSLLNRCPIVVSSSLMINVNGCLMRLSRKLINVLLDLNFLYSDDDWTDETVGSETSGLFVAGVVVMWSDEDGYWITFLTFLSWSSLNAISVSLTSDNCERVELALSTSDVFNGPNDDDAGNNKVDTGFARRWLWECNWLAAMFFDEEGGPRWWSARDLLPMQFPIEWIYWTNQERKKVMWNDSRISMSS